MKPLINQLSEEDLKALISQSHDLTIRGECCPRQCGIDRRETEPPCSGQFDRIRVASFHPHRGEEPPVSGEHGAGNIFFSSCTVGCVFCQNFPFSSLNNGRDYSLDEFSEKIRELIDKGVHNLNLTTFDHYLYPVLAALSSKRSEINIPIANNCSGYFASETLKIMMQICDIFLYDVKYQDDLIARRYSAVQDYVSRSWDGVDLLSAERIPWIEEDGILKRGVIFRHLVLPGAVDNSLGVLDRLAKYRDHSFDFRVSLMSQYFPAYRSVEFPEINRRITEDEYQAVLDRYNELGLDGWIQEIEGEGGC